MDKIKIDIYSITGDSICASAESGSLVYDRIKKAVTADKKVEISFLNVTLLTTAFLNIAIGKLYGEFKEEKLKELLSVAPETQDKYKIQLKRVIDTAKLYYKDPDQFQKSIDMIMGED